eukprot:CAMPEP_0117543812 /NCGR_PEP_ID=MMETSP0784-20121206/45251_1 /TAXON_ID=39447 /ORGANISM="" /LENGTH=72 /DNA_ID=CAMNT_0005340597 /DNA_START=49 /DNA_END=267 /DNA_ORIENTATION=-
MTALFQRSVVPMLGTPNSFVHNAAFTCASTHHVHLSAELLGVEGFVLAQGGSDSYCRVACNRRAEMKGRRLL